MQMSNRACYFRIYVRTSDGRQGWLPSSILMQTALSEETSSMSRPEDSHYRREYVFALIFQFLTHFYNFTYNIHIYSLISFTIIF